jgi:hypothetical protein
MNLLGLFKGEVVGAAYVLQPATAAGHAAAPRC